MLFRMRSLLVAATGMFSCSPLPPAAYDVPLDPTARGRSSAATRARPGAPCKPHRSGRGRGRSTPARLFSSPVVGGGRHRLRRLGRPHVLRAQRRRHVRWKVPTGEIIDSAGAARRPGPRLLRLRRRQAARARRQDRRAGVDLRRRRPGANKAFINWFEGNVAIGPTARSTCRTTTSPSTRSIATPARPRGASACRDQTWSLPAVDRPTGRSSSATTTWSRCCGQNTFALDADGASSRGDGQSAASRPARCSRGRPCSSAASTATCAPTMPPTGDERWSFATRDHIYASPAQLPDGTIVQPSADGTIYALDPGDGRLRWRFDTREPIRSSPAVDGDGHIYFGLGRRAAVRAQPGRDAALGDAASSTTTATTLTRRPRWARTRSPSPTPRAPSSASPTTGACARAPTGAASPGALAARPGPRAVDEPLRDHQRARATHHRGQPAAGVLASTCVRPTAHGWP